MSLRASVVIAVVVLLNGRQRMCCCCCGLWYPLCLWLNLWLEPIHIVAIQCRWLMHGIRFTQLHRLLC